MEGLRGGGADRDDKARGGFDGGPLEETEKEEERARGGGPGGGPLGGACLRVGGADAPSAPAELEMATDGTPPPDGSDKSEGVESTLEPLLAPGMVEDTSWETAASAWAAACSPSFPSA